MNLPAHAFDMPLIDLERRAHKRETPGDTGAVVWRTWGPDGAAPLLLLHGAHGSWSHWARNVDALVEAGRQLWVPDLPGYGESALPDSEGITPIADTLAAGLRDLGVAQSGPIDIVGFSFGGIVGGHIAARHPDLARRVIFVGTGGLGTPLGPLRLARVRGLLGQDMRDAVRHNLLQVMLHDPASVDDVAIDLQSANNALVRLDTAKLALRDKLLPALREMRAQVDAIWGEHDGPHPDPEAQFSVLRQFDPKAETVIIPAAGHWVMYEQPTRFNNVLLALLDRPARRKA